MLVTLGNRHPLQVKPEDRRGDHVTYIHVPDSFVDDAGVTHWDIPDSLDHGAVRKHFSEIDARQGITRMADVTGQNCEGLLPFIHPRQGVVTPFGGIGHFGLTGEGRNSEPTFVHAPVGATGEQHPLTGILSEWFQCPVGLPEGYEDTHTTEAGPPGVGPWVVDMDMLFTNVGRVAFNNMMGGGQVGDDGTNSATGATSMTDSGKSWTTNQWAGYRVYCGTVFGIIKSNSATVLTIDRWYTPATPGGAAGSTPGSGTATYVIADGGAISFWFMALTANTGPPAVGDTSLSGEITSAGGGLVRKIAAFAQTSGVSPTSYTLTSVYTANGSDSLPVTLAMIGIFNSMVTSNTTKTMMWETLFSSTATLSSSGDQLTAVDTISGS